MHSLNNYIMNTELSKRLSQKGITKEQLASAIGCTLQQADNIIKGRNKLIYKNALILGREFGLSPAWLMTGEGNPEMQEGAKILSREEIGEALHSYMKEHKVKTTDLARLTGYDGTSLYLILSGKRVFSSEIAAGIGKALGISPNWLLTGEGEMLSGEKPGFADVSNSVEKGVVRVAMVKKLEEENAQLRSEVTRLEAQVQQLLGMIGQLTSGKG